MNDTLDLYQEIVIDHSKQPRNFRKLEHPTCHADGFNPLCGDKVTIFVKMDGDRVADISFEGSGCAISTSSASLLTEAVKGKTRAEAARIFESFHRMVTEGPQPADAALLGKLAVFGGVFKYPARVKCASLAWHTLSAALRDKPDTVSTE